MAAEAEIFSSRTRGRVRVPLSSVDFNLVRTEFLGTPFKAEVNNGDYEKGNVISMTKKRRSRAHQKHDIYTPLVFNDSTNSRRLNGVVDSTLSSYKSDGETFKSFEGATVNFETAFKEKSRNSSGVPVASLGNPQQHIFLNFGYSNFVGKTRSLPLRIVATSSNNTLDSEYPIELDPTPLTEGFEIVLGGDYALKHKRIVCDGKSSGDKDAPTIFYLKQAESRVIHVVWTPTQEGEIREEINLVSPLGRIQITLLGIACDTVKKSTLAKMKSQPRRDLTTFHARDNITYDSQRWEDRQCATFTTWLNAVFHPESAFNRVNVEHILVEWETAKKLFDSPKMQAIRCSVEREVKHGRLAITPRSDEGHLATTPGSDRNILDEVHVREQLTKLLLSYTPRWLQLGLGIVLAMTDSERIRTNYCMSKGSLNKVIIERVLTEPSGARKHSSRCKTMSWKFECKNRIAIHQHALSQIMILVYFLDSAKRNRVLTEDPCLFDTSSSMKSSEEVLISLCQDCFSIPGSTIKHLNYEGISVCHVQNALDEFDFHVKNLAVDLKDGVCIAKLIETVTNTSNILASMRVPATTRQHKIYNVNVVLTALRHLGVPNISDITTAHIVAAHQPRTLQLLWSIIIYFDLPQFELEIVQYKASRLIQGYVRRFLGTRSYHLARHGTISFQSAYRGFVVRTRVREIKNVILIQKIWRGYRMKSAYRFNLFGILAIQRFCRRVIARNQFHMQGAAIKIQKSWRGHRCMISFGCDLMGIITIQSICRCFIAKNLVHRIVRETNAAANIQRVWRGYCTKMKFGSDMMDVVTVQSFCRRFVALNRAMKKSNTTDIASINIQRVWRGYNAKLSYGFNLMDIITVQSICRQFIARKKMFRNNACVLKIQSSIRMWAVRKCYSKFRDAAFTIQRYVRSVLASSHVCYLKTHIVHMQRVIRGWLCRKQISVPIMITSFEFGGVSTFPATTLHPHTDAESFNIISTPTSQGVGHLPPRFSLTAKMTGNQSSPMLRNSIRETEEAYSYPKNAAIEKLTTSANKGKEAPGVPSISNIEIDYFTCKTPESSCSLECSSPHDADEISFTTRHASRKPIFGAIGKIAKLVHDTDQVVKRITSQDVEPNIIFYVSGSVKETENLCNEPSANKEVAIEVDSLSTHRTYQSKHAAAIAGALIIQAHTNNRGNSAVEIQKVYRGFVARNQFIFTKFAAVIIQSAFRRHLCEINYRCLRKSAILAQALYRGRKARQEWVKIALQRNIIYAAMSLQRSESFAAAQIQRIWRGYMANVNFILLILATIEIQSSARRHITAAKFCEMLKAERRNSAALTLQRAVRVFIACKIARNSRNRRRNAAVVIQKVYRGFVARNQFIFTKFAAVIIQSAFRRHLCEINYRCLRKSAILAQALYRGMKARQKWVKIALQRNIIYAAMSVQRSESFAVTQIQRIWRCYMANVNFILLILATIKIQSSARRHITAAKFCEMLKAERRNSAALTLQRAVRVFIACKIARNSRNRRRNAAVVIQKVYRGFVARNQFIFTKFAAVIIQSAFMRHLCEINYHCLRKSAILAQALYRGRKARHETAVRRKQLQIIERESHALMAKLELLDAAQRSESFAVTQIQRIWRGYMANTDFILLILATIRIQSLARRHIAATKYRYLRMCVIYAQANCRGMMVRQHASDGREQIERARIITAVTTLQRVVRGMIVRVQVNVEVFAATEIQRSWRGYRSNANFMLTVMSAIKIQTFTRFVLAKAKLARLEKERSAAEAEYDRIELERILAEQRRNKLTHTSLPILKALSASSRTTQSLHAEAESFKLKNTETTQGVGQMTTRFSLLPASVHAAMELAEGVFRLPNGITQSSKFESLAAKAIRILQKSKNFSEVLKAVMVMEKITSQSMYECRVIIEANAHEELISIICSCNRSSPHLELIRLILSVLTNLSQHPHFLSRLASDKTINTLTDVVHMFRDKPTPFVVASSLLERMLCGNHHLVPKYFTSENKKRLCGIVSLCKENVSKLGDTKKGIRCLENIILICECELQHLK